MIDSWGAAPKYSEIVSAGVATTSTACGRAGGHSQALHIVGYSSKGGAVGGGCSGWW